VRALLSRASLMRMRSLGPARAAGVPVFAAGGTVLCPPLQPSLCRPCSPFGRALTELLEIASVPGMKQMSLAVRRVTVPLRKCLPLRGRTPPVGRVDARAITAGNGAGAGAPLNRENRRHIGRSAPGLETRSQQESAPFRSCCARLSTRRQEIAGVLGRRDARRPLGSGHPRAHTPPLWKRSRSHVRVRAYR
jgi:hypothetical protein